MAAAVAESESVSGPSENRLPQNKADLMIIAIVDERNIGRIEQGPAVHLNQGDAA